MDEIHTLYLSPNIIGLLKYRRLKCVEHVFRMEKGRGAFKILIGKSTEMKFLGISKRSWENNFRIDLKEICVRNMVYMARLGIIVEYLCVWAFNFPVP